MKCRSCKSTNIKDILSLGNQYLSKFSGEKGKKYPLDLVRCDSCSLVQLKETTPPELLYTDDYGYYSGINQIMRTHLANIAMAAEKLVELKMGDTVIDIGCNDGTLLKSYQTEGMNKIGFDPVEKFGKYADDYTFIGGYFSAIENLPHKAKVITAISMFYDLDDPNAFLKDIVKSLDPEGILIIQQNYLKAMLEQTAFDNIVHEHLEYYTLFSLNNLLRKHGLEVFDVESIDLNGGSFRTYIKFVVNTTIHRYLRVEQFSAEEVQFFVANPSIYEDFAGRVDNLRDLLTNFITNEVKVAHKKVYLYGASTRAGTLLQYCGLDHNLITAAAERNPDKFGKKILSLDIPIVSEEDARNNKPDYFLVGPWFFRDEIVEREKDFEGKLIFPLPQFSIV